MSTKSCSQCKLPFDCGSDKMGCWCEGLTIEVNTLDELKLQYDNCLCPTCLIEHSYDNINK